MGARTAEVLVELDRSRPRSLRAQVQDQLRAAVQDGRLAPGTTLPSSRRLAADLGVTRGVVVAAYEQLTAEGYLRSTPGSGTVVDPAGPGGAPTPARATAPAAPLPPRPEGPPVEVDFGAGVPDLALFPRARWARATRAALQSLPDAGLGYDDPRGLTGLRRALVGYLGRVRGVRTDEDHVVVGGGFSHGIAVLAAALAAAGHRAIAVEDPHRGAGPQLAHSPLAVRGVAVDAEGIVVDDLRATGARAVLVTPAHQAPTGAVLSPARRAQLLHWAREVDGYVIEDDYDAEFRYDRRPIGALQGMAPDRVVYCGTTSKVLAPGLRLGWTVLPPDLREPVVEVRRGTDVLTSTLLQATFAAFLAAGDLDRHLRTVRRTYRQRRDALVAAVATHLPEAAPTGVAAGLQTVLTLPPGTDEDAVVARAAQAGVRVVGLARFRTGGGTSLPPALVLGYGAVRPAAIERGVVLLADAVRASS